MTVSKIKEILAVFQESILEEMSLTEFKLNFKIECSFLAKLIKSEYKFFYGVFKGCQDVFFQPWEDEFNIISDIKEIVLLELELLNVEREADGYLKIYVNCKHRFTGGNLLIKCEDLKIFDEDFQEMGLIDLTELSEKYWYSSDKAEG